MADPSGLESMTSPMRDDRNRGQKNILSSEGTVVHEEELNVVDVLDEERLVAGRSHVTSLLVGTITNLNPPNPSTIAHSCIQCNILRSPPQSKAIKEGYSVPTAWQPGP